MRILITSICIIIGLSLMAQTSIVKGKVKSERGESLVGASVYVYESGSELNEKTKPLITIATVTDKRGSYSLEVPLNIKFQVVCSYLGYGEFRSKKISFASSETMTLNIKLKAVATAIDSVVVTRDRISMR